PLTDFGGKTSIFSHPVYLFLRKFSLQDSRGGSKRLLPVRPERHLSPITSVSDTSSSVERVSVFAGRALMDALVNRKDFCIIILMYLIDIMEIIYI
ncbi:hypothetical protein ACRWVZ_20290, partial [Escherichia coli]